MHDVESEFLDNSMSRKRCVYHIYELDAKRVNCNTRALTFTSAKKIAGRKTKKMDFINKGYFFSAPSLRFFYYKIVHTHGHSHTHTNTFTHLYTFCQYLLL